MPKFRLLVITMTLLFSVPANRAHAVDGAVKLELSPPPSGVQNASSDSLAPKVELGKELAEEEIRQGLREVLDAGTRVAANQLSQKGGFNDSPDVRIQIPDTMKRVDNAMRKIGKEDLVTKLEVRMNRAAEKASPKVAGYFLLAIKQVTIKNPRDVLNGNDDAATEYLIEKMRPGLMKILRPVIKNQMINSGTYAAYEKLMDEYRRIPFEPKVRARIEDHMVTTIVDTYFSIIAKEEDVIRSKQEKRTTELLQKMFARP